MKKLFILLIVITSFSAFANDCTISLNSFGLVEESSEDYNKIKRILSKKGLLLIDEEDTEFTLNYYPSIYHYEGSYPNYLVPVEVYADITSNLNKDFKVSAKSQGVAFLGRNESKKQSKNAKRATRRVVKKMKFCYVESEEN